VVKIKICLTFSAGGHRYQMLQLEKLYKKHDHYFLTFRERTTKDLRKKARTYFVTNQERSIYKTIKSFFESLNVFLKEMPDVVISTGAGVTLPTCFFAKLFGKKVVYIESFSRITEPSLAGKIAYHFSDLFIVQWKPLMKHYKNAVYGGTIF